MKLPWGLNGQTLSTVFPFSSTGSVRNSYRWTRNSHTWNAFAKMDPSGPYPGRCHDSCYLSRSTRVTFGIVRTIPFSTARWNLGSFKEVLGSWACMLGERDLNGNTIINPKSVMVQGETYLMLILLERVPWQCPTKLFVVCVKVLSTHCHTFYNLT